MNRQEEVQSIKNILYDVVAQQNMPMVALIQHWIDSYIASCSLVIL